MAMKESSRKVFDFLVANYGTKVTGNDIAAALGVSVPTVTGSVNGLVKKGLAERIEEVTTGADDKEVRTKYITLTEEGLSFNPDATEAPAAE